jgi:spore maturation protein CgeB
LHPYRAKFFEGLLEFDVRIWGSVASANVDSPSRRFFQARYVAEEEKAIAFGAAKLLVNAMNFAEVRGVNNTLFEAAGCGAFQICDERPTLAEFFKPDEEVVTFRDRAELVEKIRYYLSHEAERRKIAQAASARAHAEHTYQKRLSEMLRVAKLS